MPAQAKTATVELTAKHFIKRLEALRPEKQAQAYERAFKTDEFLGVRMGRVFALAKEFMALPLAEIEKLLESRFHEARVGAVSVMDFQARSKKLPAARKRELYELYVRRHDGLTTGPIAQLIFIPFMTTGAGVQLLGPWFGTGTDRGIALLFIVARACWG